MADQSSMTDGEVPELTAAELAEFRPAREVLTPEQFAAVTGRGRPKAEVKKVPVTIRLDPRIVETFKAGGPGWQTRMQQVLAKSIKGSSGGAKAVGPKVRAKAAEPACGKKRA